MQLTNNQALINKTDYIGNLVYEHDTLNYATLPEGKYTFAESNYEYFLKDHLGNVRAIIDQNATITEANNYYPFGMQIA